MNDMGRVTSGLESAYRVAVYTRALDTILKDEVVHFASDRGYAVRRPGRLPLCSRCTGMDSGCTHTVPMLTHALPTRFPYAFPILVNGQR